MLHCLGTPLNHFGEPTVRRIFLAFLILIGTATGAVAADKSETIVFPFDPQVGDIFCFRIEKSDVTVGENSTAKPTSLADISIEFLGLQEEGYLYQLKYLDFKPKDTALVNAPLFAKARTAYMSLSLEYYADETGSPFAVRSLEEVKNWMLSMAPPYSSAQSSESKKAHRAIRYFRENLTAESAAEILLKEVGWIFYYTGSEISTNEKFEIDVPTTWQLTGTKLVTKTTMELVELHENTATLEMHTGYTRKSVLEGLRVFADKLHQHSDPATQRKSQEKLRNLATFDLHQETISEVSLSSGLPVQLKAVSIVDMGTTKRTVIYDITRLAAKPGPAR